MRILFTICMLFLFQFGNAQDDLIRVNDKVSIETNDGNQFVGKIIEIDNEKIIIETNSLGSLTILQDNIKSMESESSQAAKIGEVDKKGHPIDYHNSTHYLATQSAYGLKKGQAYYENIWIFFNSFAYGVTDNFTIAGGGEIASILFGGDVPILYITPKLSIAGPNDKVSFSVGATLFTAPGDNFTSVGIAQGAVTLGNRNNNFTFGTGFGFSFGDGFTDAVIPLQLAFMTRLSRKISLVSDNTVLIGEFNDPIFIASLAMRYHFKRNGAAFNAGLFRPLNDLDGFIGLPFVSATIPIGN